MPADQAFNERVPPHNLEAEQSVLGSCLIDRDAVLKVGPLLRPEDFYAEAHGLIWGAITAASTEGTVDLITVQDQLKRSGHINAVGGLVYLTTLINTVPTTANVEEYARIVRRTAQLRRIQTVARQTAESCYVLDDPDEVLGNLQATIDREVRSAGGSKGLAPIAGRIGAYAEQRYQTRNQPNPDWLPSKFPTLRERMPYLRGESTLVAMPPGNGKTTFLANEALFLAEIGYEVAVFQLEMRDHRMYDKWIALRARIPIKALRMGLLDEPDWFLFRSHGQELNALENLALYCETEETMSNIRWHCLRRKAERGHLDFIFIDFLDRAAQKEARGRDERYDQLLGRIAGTTSTVAKECNAHAVLLAQVDVKVLARPNPIPGMADLTNSKTNLTAWPDNVLTGILPIKAKGDGKGRSPAIWGRECDDKRWKNTIVFNVAKGRFSDGDELFPVYAELSTGFLGSLRRPWPWQKDCPEDQVGQWDSEADERHLAAMREFRRQTIQAQADDILI